MSKISASVLAFEKKLIPSDGLLYGTNWENRLEATKSTALELQEKSVRGTISNRMKANISNDPTKLNKEIDKANLQRVDSCALSPEQDTLKLQFTLKVLSGIENPSACNSQEFLSSYQTAIKNYISQHQFNELSERYAINLANGRFLWRNRVGCEHIEIHIKSLNSNHDFVANFNAQEHKQFADHNQDSKKLAQLIAGALSGKEEYLLLEITAYAKIGKAQDVYPSEELVLDKSNDNKEKKSKILYDVNNVAALHSQKIGNAIRTVDTWYKEHEEQQQPISADPYGAVTTLGRAFRSPKEKTDFFTLFDKWAQGEEIETDEQHFVVAVLVRGGVFGESGK
jgi:CRISPR-associated protein Csy3